jgi:predicted acyl esterase
VADPTRPVRVDLPGIVHRFAAGHRLRLVVASGDLNYRGGLAAAPVTIASPALTLPVVG